MVRHFPGYYILLISEQYKSLYFVTFISLTYPESGNLSLFLHQCIFIMRRPRVHIISQL